MNRLLRLAILLWPLASPLALAAAPPAPLVTGLKSPQSVATGTDGRVYLAVSGAVLVLDKGKAVPFASGFDDPRGLAGYLEWLFVADRQQIWRIDRKGKAEVFVQAKAFPAPPQSLQDLAADPESGTLYVCDAGDQKGKGGAIYRITPKGQVSVVTSAQRWPALHTPKSVVLDGASHLLVLDAGTGTLHRIKLTDATTEKLADGFGGGAGLAWDRYGRLFVSDGPGGRIFVIPRPGEKAVLLADGLQTAADLCLDPSGKKILVADLKAGTLTALPALVPGVNIDESPLPVGTAVAFPQLQWAGWKGITDSGKAVPLRPLVLTHAGDGTNRVFVATQHGVIHVFPNDQKATQTRVFLDLQDRVSYNDDTNEEGFLGMAFHPRYKETGEFFVFYTTKKAKLTNIVARFRVSKEDPNRADPNSEEQLLRITKPFWNHDGGTLCFGPDGYLYITHGDGGAANDPFDNGQNLKTVLGKVLRIDVDRKDAGKNYATPKDNPFLDQPDARPEIYAYGVRNLWRMAFDRKTGQLWAGDVGQNLYEEIDLIKAGGNYGWNRREGLHPFGAKGTGPRKEFIEPIWEYHHDIGKSITGGTVYRGTRLPELEGAYLYADYVGGQIWALRYDEAQGRVIANRTIRERGFPILSFGEDEKGEVYFLTYTPSGQGISWFVKPEAKPVK